ncbi:MAG TPA: glycosyltransferase family 4 protein [Pyrinomonadaceae bacterium]|nr:glycosyltransferase family 4 protein [Pyrinomonadaceae bacterium]
MKQKICHIISDVDRSYFFEALGEALEDQGYEVSFIFLSKTIPYLFGYHKERGRRVEFINFTSRKGLPRITWAITKILKNIKPDIVHTHLSEATTTGLIACLLLGIKNRIHTRHHSSEAHTYYAHAVYYDKFNNSLSKRIVANTGTTAEVLIGLENVNPDKVRVIHYGYDLDIFVSDEKVVTELRTTYQLTDNYPVVGVLSRFVEWKGVQYIIPAFQKLLGEYPNAKLVLAGGVGNYSSTILKLLEETLTPDQYTLIDFESRVFDLYKTFDMFVHVPISKDFEAFGQVYIEPLMLEIPSIFTLSGIANDIINDGENALVVPFRDSDTIYESMLTLLRNQPLREKIVRQGKNDVLRMFNIKELGKNLNELYGELRNR